MSACSVDGCRERVKARALCSRHYHRAYRAAGKYAEAITMPSLDPYRWVNPLVCVCAVPDAHPRIDFGQCKRCHRCPLSNFHILQKETAA